MTTAGQQGLEIRADLADSHAAIWRHIAAAGTWWTAEDRLAIAEEARLARDCGLCADRKAAVSPFAVDGEHENAGRLPTAVIDVIHRIITDPGRLTQSWLSGVLAAGLEDTHYVELVAVAVFTHSLDVFQRALGLDRVSLPVAASGAAEPTRARPEIARSDGAWVDLVPDGEEGGAFSREVYGGMESVPYIGRALSLVPAEVAALRGLSGPHYMELVHVSDPHYETPGRAIDRLQMELVASRVSLINDCFYWTTAHAGLLRASSMVRGAEVDLSKLKGGSGAPADDSEGQDDGGVRHGRRLLAFTEAVMTNDREAIEQSRKALEAAIGPAGIVDTAAVIAMFNVVDRVADSTGIPIDAAGREFRYGVGQELGITHLTPEARAR